MATRKGIKTLTITGVASGMGIVGANVIDGRTSDVTEIAAFGDALYSSVPSPVLHAQDLTLDVLDEGAWGDLTDLVGTTKAITISSTYWDGTSAGTSSNAVSGDFVIMDATGDTMAVDGDSKSVVHLTIRRQAD